MMIYRLYNIKQNRYATPNEYTRLLVNKEGDVIKVLIDKGQTVYAKQWKVQYGFIHSSGKKYYEGDQNIDERGTTTIEFDGYSFNKFTKLNSEFYDVNYGGQRRYMSTYSIMPKTELW